MSTYRQYTTDRIARELAEEAEHKDDPTPAEYEAALEQLGVNINDQN